MDIHIATAGSCQVDIMLLSAYISMIQSKAHLNDPQHCIPATSPSIGLDGEPETTKEFVANQLELQYTTRTPRLAFSSPPLALDPMGIRRQ